MGVKRRTKVALKRQQEWRDTHPDASIIKQLKRSFKTSLEIHQIEPTVGQIPSLIVPIPEESVIKIDKWYGEQHKRRMLDNERKNTINWKIWKKGL